MIDYLDTYERIVKSIFFDDDTRSYHDILSDLYGIMDSLNIPIKRGRPGWIWDGKAHYPEQESERIFNEGNECMLINCLRHELSHNQIASPERRLMKDYGLGTSYASTESAEDIVNDNNAEESAATLLDILWMYKLGMRDEKYLNHVSVAFMDGDELFIASDNIERDFEYLLDRGVIDANLVPQVTKWNGK